MIANKKDTKKHITEQVDWLQSLKQFFINVSYHIFIYSQSNFYGSVLKQSHQS